MKWLDLERVKLNTCSDYMEAYLNKGGTEDTYKKLLTELEKKFTTVPFDWGQEGMDSQPTKGESLDAFATRMVRDRLHTLTSGGCHKPASEWLQFCACTAMSRIVKKYTDACVCDSTSHTSTTTKQASGSQNSKQGNVKRLIQKYEDMI